MFLHSLSASLQQSLADKALEIEAHRQYRELVAGQKRGKVSDCRKLTEAMVVTTEIVIKLWEEREQRDAKQAQKKARKQQKATPIIHPPNLVPQHSQNPATQLQIQQTVTVHGFSSTGELEHWEEPAEEWEKAEEAEESGKSEVSEDAFGEQDGLDPGDSDFRGSGIDVSKVSDVSSGLRRSGRPLKPRNLDII